MAEASSGEIPKPDPETQTDQAQLGRKPHYWLPFSRSPRIGPDGKPAVKLSLIVEKVTTDLVIACKSHVIAEWPQTKLCYPESQRAAAWDEIKDGLVTGKFQWGSSACNSFLQGPAGAQLFVKKLLEVGGNPLSDTDFEAFLIENKDRIRETLELISLESKAPKS
jgi:hypothetical protein